MDNAITRWKVSKSQAAFVALLVATGALYFYNLTANGYGNEFYAAAAQAGTKSWKAFFFGSTDWSSAITVDKTPAFLWPQEIFGRIFGFNSWSMLAPQVLEAVGSVALLYAALKRWFGPAAGLLAGAILAITPVAALMFRFNNPDAALTFLLVAGAYCTTRAMESPKSKWMILTGVCLGFAFLAKELQALLVVPAFAVAYFVAAPTTAMKRIVNLIAGLAAMLVSAGWWIALALFWPSASRPYFGGSTHNSIIEVILGGNGVSRLTGDSSGGGGMGANFSGTSGWNRLFNDLMGGQISWLIPAAVIALVAGLVVTLHTRRTNHARAALILWGGWFVVTAFVFSFMNGTVHTYYTVALAPAIAAVLGIVCTHLWANRSAIAIRMTLASMVAGSGAWSYSLLQRTPDWHPQLRPIIAALAVLSIVALLAEPFVAQMRQRVMHSVAAVALAACLLGPAAYTLQTIATGHHGSIPSAGPTSTNTIGGFGGGPTGIQLAGAQQGGPGSTETTTGAALVSLLKSGASGYTWAAATVGSQSSATLQLSADEPVMSMGGFNGGDPYPTLAQFKAYVTEHKIHYFVVDGGGMGMGGPGGGNSEVTSWVEANFTASTVGGATVYDLSSASGK